MEKVPLGYSDLTTDEGFVVTLFREWRESGPTRAVAEHRIACHLQSDSSYPALDPLFRLFGSYYDAAEPCSCQSDILSEDEEELLEILCTSNHSSSDRGLAPDCRAALLNAAIVIRPCEAIPRSGHDQLLYRVAQGYGAAFAR